MCDNETYLENEQSEATHEKISPFVRRCLKFEMLQKSDITSVHSPDKKNRLIM